MNIGRGNDERSEVVDGETEGNSAAVDQCHLGREWMELGGTDVAVAALDGRTLEERWAPADLHGDVAHLDTGQRDLALGGHGDDEAIDRRVGIVADLIKRAIQRP